MPSPSKPLLPGVASKAGARRLPWIVEKNE
jgi:hypothetical protein